MDNQIENKTDVRISIEKYLINIGILFIVFLFCSSIFIMPALGIFELTALIPLGVLSIYLIYFSSKRIAHAVINKLIFLPFIFLFSYYILNITNPKYILAILYIVIYMIILILISLFLPKKINERRYIFSSEKYIRIADFFDISKPMENILLFKFRNNISRHKYFVVTLFIILANIFIFIDLFIIIQLAGILGYHGFGLGSFILIFIFIEYGILMLCAFIILISNRLINIFGTNKYNILIFTIIFVLFYFLHYVIPYNDIYDIYNFYKVAAFVLILFIGIIPPKKDKVNG